MAKCNHNSYWTTIYGNCMACRAEEAEARVKEHEFRWSKMRRRIEELEADLRKEGCFKCRSVLALYQKENSELAAMIVSPSWWCRLFGCKTTGPYYGMPQSHCWNCGMKTGYANPDLHLPHFVKPGKLA